MAQVGEGWCAPVCKGIHAWPVVRCPFESSVSGWCCRVCPRCQRRPCQQCGLHRSSYLTFCSVLCVPFPWVLALPILAACLVASPPPPSSVCLCIVCWCAVVRCVSVYHLSMFLLCLFSFYTLFIFCKVIMDIQLSNADNASQGLSSTVLALAGMMLGRQISSNE